ncbi:MAG: hypothetical protein A3J09_01810 [Candidatus Zambryskibacteria bacterium RIFCSPLOWO2_02_FULL_51_21]|uniref:SHS2 domain-containing protein n=1 Tax=Candidatus Zambryskibacteria bacterium RIFCSPHIGHO2_02_FULL_43_37 TaxID=1802749 RepID=A0A1G2TGN6_9BACT|nr:MAG: hypothetical protein A2723_01810 [Candidatus Zambryskibacteria bacterium RIFCSPHIGHO2_01_FULL_52_18]OHA96465.1 MAG: hypothetical protein A3D49_01090 [Candidatus Zambryskibacteria bacterium RIFCSPHIGHO2_02_FULL_43_37]OHB07232.1 MAG: hypothetical protein A2944_01550 [Candidatus Zambryskibacteria bacterium RIFCSPLOWO2_01_FULL_52_12]OHB11272.1 MAG: hypothetical protein A3J09_01810 [Candidatus Zambryskibacteria bacterium RIFCSPLOWO2_02_FULL_51_21]
MAFFSKFFGNREPRALGIDIGSSAIKVVQLKKKNGQAILETYGELALGPYGGLSVGQAVQLPTDKISAALADLMKEKEVNVTTKSSGLSIPFSSSLMAVIEMPEVAQKELAIMVPIEARKYIPVPISEVMLDWSVIPRSDVRVESVAEELPQEGGGFAAPAAAMPKIDVLMVAIHKETIARFQEIVSSAGLDAGFFEIEIFATSRAVMDEGLRPVMIMDMGAATTKLYIIERGIVRASHTINRGSQDITSNLSKSLNMTPEQAEVMKREVGAAGDDKSVNDVIALVLDYIFAEANTVLLDYEQRYNKAVSKTILVGGGAALKGLLELAKANFKTEAELAEPFSKVAAPAFLEKILRETGPEFAVAIGLALRKLAEEEE